MAKKPSQVNPLFAAGGSSSNFSVAESFGISASLAPPVNVSSAEEDSFLGGGDALAPPPPMTSATPKQPDGASLFPSPMSFFRTTPARDDHDPFSQVSGVSGVVTTPSQLSPQSVPLNCPPGPASPPAQLQTPLPPPAPALATPAPHPGHQLFAPPPVATVAPMTPASSIKRPVYAPTPFLVNPSTPAGLPPLPEPKTVQHSAPLSSTPALPPSLSAPDLPALTPQYPGSQVPTNNITSHWFYRQSEDPEVWKPFSIDDSALIDLAQQQGRVTDPIAVDGTRYDVHLERRVKVPVYWPGKEIQIRCCSWFRRRDPEGRWIPYDETASSRLESEYQSAASSGRWQVKVVLNSEEWVMLHSPEVMMHFPTSSTSHGALDDWGQVQPQTDPSLRPQVVHRGLEGLPDIPDGESVEVDHVFFVVHGIGAACDIKFRPLEEVVDGFRDLTADMSEKHFAGAHLASKVNRVEFLPVHWHDKLHGEDAGTDARIQPLTLRSIPKLRSFVNDTLLDVLFYTSPIYCQTILDTVCGEINRIYKLFSQRNPGDHVLI